jgi:hypothetical protein
MIRLRGSFKEALNCQQAVGAMLQRFFVAEVRAAACEKRALVCCTMREGAMRSLTESNGPVDFERRHLLQRRRVAFPRVSKERLNHAAMPC